VTAVTIAAALFAVAHLPAAFAGVADWQVGAVVRTIGWNALLGLMFGMFFFCRSLEAAVSAHICFHFGTAFAAAL
jgi:membrane protease YdiL (CAAX protease family)